LAADLAVPFHTIRLGTLDVAELIKSQTA
jgi:hypothetical protein